MQLGYHYKTVQSGYYEFIKKKIHPDTFLCCHCYSFIHVGDHYRVFVSRIFVLSRPEMKSGFDLLLLVLAW